MSGVVLLILRIALMIALYLFLGYALFVLWHDLKRRAEFVSARRLPAITLTLSPGGSSLRFTTSEINLGRDPACEYVLDDPTVSSRHARLSYHHNQWWVEDLQSTNGTFLNQEPVTTPLVIANLDELRCGQVVVIVGLGENGEIYANRV